MEINDTLRGIRLFLFDMDGTLYLGNRLFDFTPELLSKIRENGGRYMFMTNNSSKSVADYIKKLEGLGIKSEYEDFITSSQATAYYLKKHHSGQTLYVCGTESLKAELRQNGFEVSCELDKIDCIVMGFDTELTFKSYMMCRICCLLAPIFRILRLIPIMFALPSLEACPTAVVCVICFTMFQSADLSLSASPRLLCLFWLWKWRGLKGSKRRSLVTGFIPI